ncbi:biopolymer transporter Tol, partial [Xanthomonas citri pv. citri]
ATLPDEAPDSDAFEPAQPHAGVASVPAQSDTVAPPIRAARGQPVAPVAAEPAASTPAAPRQRRSMALAVACVALLVVLGLAAWTS